MSQTRKWLVISGALALGASAAVVTGSLAGQEQSAGPGVTLNPAASASTVPRQDTRTTILASAADNDGASAEGTTTSAKTALSPASPASADSPASPASADSAESAPSPASANSPDSPATPGSPSPASPISPATPVSADGPDSPASAD